MGMTPERFTDWLQGFVEIQQSESITDTQWLIIKDHLKLVFDNKTPNRSLYPHINIQDFMKKADSPLDLIGKKVDQSFWVNNITC
jgi:hypothetical protein